MPDIRSLDPGFAVSPQITPDDIAAIRAAGYGLIVNNRPDGEEPHQPDGDAIADTCAATGLGYAAIPVGGAGIGMAELDALADAMAVTGPILAFCRSGTRSCHLWALTKARAGADPEALCEAAGNAGYDLTALRPTLERLAAQA